MKAHRKPSQSVSELRNPFQPQRFKLLQDRYNTSLDELLEEFDCFVDGTPCGGAASGVGVSGAGFMVSSSKRFFAKTLNEIEWWTFGNITGPYIDHMLANPKSLVSLIFTAVKRDWYKPCSDLMSIAPNGNCWMVMNNALGKKFHKQSIGGKYDLKGVQGRIDPQDKDILSKPWKMPDAMEEQFGGVFLSPTRRQELIAQLEKDTDFLASQHLMDYSLLVQVEELGECDDEALVKICQTVEHPSGPAIAHGAADKKCPIDHSPSGRQATSSDLSRTPWVQQGPFADHNGYVVGVRGNIIFSYSMGLIDILASWHIMQIGGTWQKYVERKGEHNSELVEPWAYKNRYMTFMKAKILSTGLEPGQTVRDPTCECSDYHRRHAPGAKSPLACEVSAA